MRDNLNLLRIGQIFPFWTFPEIGLLGRSEIGLLDGGIGFENWNLFQFSILKPNSSRNWPRNGHFRSNDSINTKFGLKSGQNLLGKNRLKSAYETPSWIWWALAHQNHDGLTCVRVQDQDLDQRSRSCTRIPPYSLNSLKYDWDLRSQSYFMGFKR